VDIASAFGCSYWTVRDILTRRTRKTALPMPDGVTLAKKRKGPTVDTVMAGWRGIGAAQRRKEKEMAIGPNVVDDCEGMTEEDYWRGMDEAMQDEEGDEPFCTCSTGHGIEETDWNQCDSCGKPIYDEEPAVPPAPTFEEKP
jgi:hypothetical protein